MDKNSKIYLAGHQGLVGSALERHLRTRGYNNLLTRRFDELDLRRQDAVEEFFQQFQPEYVFLAAAKVGGMWANYLRPGEFIYDNILIQSNVLEAARKYAVKKLLFLGSSCIYPKFAPQPIKEENLLQGELEPSNQAYAIAKIAGIAMCQAYRAQYGCNFIAIMPNNLYGPGDNFHPENGHVLPAMINKFHQAMLTRSPQLYLWGTGTPRREFLYVDDLATACYFLMKHYDEADIINVGSGEEYSISELAAMVAAIVGYQGEIIWDSSKPDGTPRKLLDASRINALGWHSRVSLWEGLKVTYDWYLKNL
ncbi:GDP-L-fucose synthase family protein [Syntrophomonas wolfei]|uniref:GDP-L-fucose synthase n=1 Tax=Syntrophomonas wolfei subsp. wolfei (strain DSM 2245B / Goettingen) TaxID=335541 RepID=Q0AZA6_SYNWW|nr:GDP-L-fucose synthase [Syntrophomonas wolfei]ABI67948.1 GDP-fucose synthetase [Syntrophomonas wolfei subsp. wolfei str. Goettingen G311]